MTWLWILILVVVAPPVLLAGRAQYRATQRHHERVRQAQALQALNAALSGLGDAIGATAKGLRELGEVLQKLGQPAMTPKDVKRLGKTMRKVAQ